MGPRHAEPPPQEGPRPAHREAAVEVRRRLSHAPDPTGRAFPRSHRLTRGGDLQLVRREGKRIRTEHLEVRALASLLSHPRVGFIVPKYKHGSVDRNRLKRRLREIVRTAVLPLLGPPVDVVVRALPQAYDASFETLHAQLARTVGAMRKAGEPKPPQPPRPEPA